MLGLGDTPEETVVVVSGFQEPGALRNRLTEWMRKLPLKTLEDHPYKRAFEAYLNGDKRALESIKHEQSGTPLTVAVWDVIATVPFGQVITYKALAQAANTKAYRAVGSICGKNYVPVIVPCHRVIREPGDIGGYTPDVRIKKFLLEEVERVKV